MLLVVSCHQSHNGSGTFVQFKVVQLSIHCAVITNGFSWNTEAGFLPILSLIICSSTKPCKNLLPIETKVTRSCTNATLLSILYYMKPDCNGIFLSSPKRLVYNASIELKRGSRIKCHGILINGHELLEYMQRG